MIDVVPGDGSGFEVYAKSVTDIKDLLTKMSIEIEDLQGTNKSSFSVDYVASALSELYEFQAVTGCDNAEQFKSKLHFSSMTMGEVHDIANKGLKRVFPDQEVFLFHELRYIAGISNGQVKRVADAAVARYIELKDEHLCYNITTST